jgi:hypothetical protein
MLRFTGLQRCSIELKPLRIKVVLAIKSMGSQIAIDHSRVWINPFGFNLGSPSIWWSEIVQFAQGETRIEAVPLQRIM